MKKLCIVLIIVLTASLSLAAQIFPSAPVDPVVNGIFGSQEYPQVVELSRMKLGYALSQNSQVMHFALEAPTTGWVSIGLGSNRMHGAHIIIGYDAITSQVISEETGRGHSHSPSSRKIVRQSAIKEAGGKTTLEFSIPASNYNSGRELRLIVAYGTQDDVRSKHIAYASHVIRFQR